VDSDTQLTVTPVLSATILSSAYTLQKSVARLNSNAGLGLVVNGAGNVGIWTTTPMAPLDASGMVDVDGNIRARGTLYSENINRALWSTGTAGHRRHPIRGIPRQKILAWRLAPWPGTVRHGVRPCKLPSSASERSCCL